MAESWRTYSSGVWELSPSGRVSSMKTCAVRAERAISSFEENGARASRIAHCDSSRRSRRTRPAFAWLTSTNVSRLRKCGTRAFSTLA